MGWDGTELNGRAGILLFYYIPFLARPMVPSKEAKKDSRDDAWMNGWIRRSDLRITYLSAQQTDWHFHVRPALPCLAYASICLSMLPVYIYVYFCTHITRSWLFISASGKICVVGCGM